MTSAFYRLDDGLFHPTELTRGPWDVRAQHGGPPSALLARAAEAEGIALELPHLARLTVELLKPVPLAALAVELSVDKRGRSAARLSLRLTHEGTELARATALLLRVREIDAQVAPPSAPPILPDASAPFDFPFFQSDVGYHTAIELRLARGDFGSTPTFMWMRPRHPLVEGEVTTGTQRAVICVDSGNGVSPVLDWRRHGFVNPDVTIALHRPPTGEWIGLDARTDVDPATGLGTAHSCMWDLERPFGYGLQSLLCDPR